MAYFGEYLGNFAGNYFGDVGGGGGFTYTDPGIANVLAGVTYWFDSVLLTGTLAFGTYTNPGIANVRLSTSYVFNSVTLVGTLTLPDVADVRSGTTYGAAGVEFTGTLTGGGASADQIADVVLRRTMAHVEASADGDPLSLHSLYGMIQMKQKSSVSGTTMTVRQTDGTTTLGTLTLTVSAGAVPVTGVQ